MKLIKGALALGLALSLALSSSGAMAEGYHLPREFPALEAARQRQTAFEAESCDSEEDFVALLREIGRDNQMNCMSFKITCSKAFMERLKADDEALLHQLERAGGLADVHYGYNSATTLDYKNCMFCDDVPYLTSPADLEAALLRAERDQPRYLFFDATPEMQAYMEEQQRKQNSWFELDAITDTHPFTTYWNWTTWTKLIKLKMDYSRGALIARAWETGDTSTLNPKELKTYEKAAQVVRSLEDGGDQAIARQIHDYLCRAVDYDKDKKEEHRGNAIGAVLEGKATCSGYADAFYMLCRMAGLETRVQSGWSGGQRPASLEELGRMHAWNLVKVDGRWLMVDVTWDDQGNRIGDTYFLMGKREAAAERGWEESPATVLWAE